MARTKLLDMNVPQNDQWVEAIYTVLFLRNRLLTEGCQDHKIPYEVIHNRPPKLDCARLFGSRVYVHKEKESCSETFDLTAFLSTPVG